MIKYLTKIEISYMNIYEYQLYMRKIENEKKNETKNIL